MNAPFPIPSRAQQEARWAAYWAHQREIYRIAEEGLRQEVDAMCERIRARKAVGIPDPVALSKNEAQHDYEVEREAGWDWR